MAIAKFAAWFVCVAIFAMVVISDPAMSPEMVMPVWVFFAVGVGGLIVAFPTSTTQRGCVGKTAAILCVIIISGFLCLGIALTLD